ncbi:class II poly(R)-hydroxyalkanoic acid synthase [Pseudomonas sp. 5P_3.1_Bac2]|uniref:class II poly(R)-hydroxyalkanoic acid synthase n=1 Tax=Pseudomonas sp. 5P_3.1_Bac2 TaxID=2971617 RepID=UPI0021C88851|nr:class II poly(R)-hydroxyalkanoic acid synthase [Pseudomonas sp. 5P_3.1_Bac2]MCU1717851.1 class II poly(R)-hydroxyalkanoic acid synthase [Pseudomonas sp. 5P_3.1_Bac2]
MPELPAKPKPSKAGAHLNVHNAVVGLRGRDLLSTLRQLALHSVKRPLHTARHAQALGSQLGRILLGDQPYSVNPKDARFKDPSWQHNPVYQRTLQGYLACRQQLSAWVNDSQLSADDQARAHFVLSQLGDALAPSNSPLNPLVLKELFNTGGASLLRGLNHLYDDLLNNHGLPSQVSKHAFEVGRNLAATGGAVVFRNELLELIQYKPMTEKQYAKPLLIVPSQINKFYIFDLASDNSFVQYALKNGLQTFIVSWRNPDPRHREWGLSSYVHALEQALDACLQITASKSLNLLGACAGGLTSAALQGHLQGKRMLRKVASASYMVSLLDSQIDSPALLFADELSIEAAKRRSYQQGVLEGRDMARIFAWMRPNELIWHYWINNYLLGKEPPAFDILYWNNDNTRLPAALHGELIDFFKYNPLTRAGALEVCGTPVDLSKVKVDSFTVAGCNDHITPWDAVYRSASLLGGKREFVLANSGHIQSILNPPGHPKAGYRHSHDLASDPRAWYHAAEEVKGSWWPAWLSWLQQRSGAQHNIQPRLGSAQHPAMDAAPGTYVHMR